MARQGRNRRRDARPAPDRSPRPRVWWRRPRVAVIVVTLVVAGCAVWWWRAPAPSRPPDILLISVDTLRADHLGCYGYGLRTPNIDRLAAEGVVFDAAMAPVPLTLPSHASMLTGLIPPRHGVRANGDFRLPDRIETLAEVLQKRGYQTAAFIGAIPLDRSGGLNQGFDHYDDEISVQSVDAEKKVQRKERFANEVFDLAAAWLRETDPQRPVFAFVHVFDPHAPGMQALPGMDTPSYDGEIHFVDRAMGPLLSGLRRDPRWTSLVTVFTADHGEGLNDHQEETHGMFVYQSTLHVPLIVHGVKGVSPRRIRETVGVVDIGPTLLELAGAEAWTDVDGRSLVGTLDGEAPESRDYYFESWYPSLRFGWSPLRGIRRGSTKYIQAPRPELYELASDPGESKNLYEQKGSVTVSAFVAELDAIGEGLRSPLAGSPNRANQAALESLGYVSAPSVVADPDRQLLDPKDQIDVIKRFRAARQEFLKGRLNESLRIYASLEESLKGSPRFYEKWGMAASRARKWDSANEIFRKGLSLDPMAEQLRFNLALGLWKANHPEAAEREFETLLRQNPDHARAHLHAGRLKRDRLRDPAGAADHFRRFLELAPDDAEAEVVRKGLADVNG